MYKYYDRVNFEGPTPLQLMKMKADNFDLVVKGWQLSRGKALLENTPIEVKISRDQIDWLNSLKEKLIQVQEDLSFYNNLLEEFTAEDIVLLRLDFRSNITQKSSAVMTTADAVVTMNITVNAIIMDDVDIANDSCIWYSDQHE